MSIAALLVLVSRERHSQDNVRGVLILGTFPDALTLQAFLGGSVSVLVPFTRGK